MPESPSAVVVTCEHGGNQVPAPFAALFSWHQALLQTHRGCDAGALYMARWLARTVHAPLHASEITRLLVDLNRSPGHPGQFSEITRSLPPEVRQDILDQHYTPYRLAVEQAMAEAIAASGHVVHISSHSFTPVLNGKVREAEIGLLYDPARPAERRFCENWLKALQAALPEMRIRRNYPYRGASDGFTAYLRKQHPDAAYAGIELEINQNLVGEANWTAFCRRVGESLARTLTACGP